MFFWAATGVFGFLLPFGLPWSSTVFWLNRVGENKPMSQVDPAPNEASENSSEKVIKSDAEWRRILTPEQYYILRKKGTEQPYTGVYNDHFEKGLYKCAGCGQVLFSSETKYPSHCGWPAFSDVEKAGRVIRRIDRSYGMVRTEVLCSRCGGHLGHVFEDGPPPTGLRYCINSAALLFEPSPPQNPQNR
ncbi:MAG: peptide-methionine (R)-S-oxide reductase MsrB [Anaerohalosphaeraceae bacterium]